MEKIDNQKYFSQGNEIPALPGVIAPIACKGPNGEKAMYDFPYASAFWDLRFIVGKEEFYGADFAYSRWFQLPYCNATQYHDQLLEESKLLFDFGSMIFAKLGVEVDGEPKDETIFLGYIAATSEYGEPVRSRFMKTALDGFYLGTLAKVNFILSLANSKKRATAAGK